MVSEMNAEDLGFRHRGGMLLGVGMFIGLMGLLFLGSAAVTVFSWEQTLADFNKAAGPDGGQGLALALATAGNALIGALTIWLGIGVAMGFRWGRALLAGASAMAVLGFGSVAVSFAVEALAFAMLGIQGIRTGLELILLLTLCGISVALLIFSFNEDTRLTSEHLDKKSRWTERCPDMVFIGAFVVLVSGVIGLVSALGDTMPETGGMFLAFSVATYVTVNAMFVVGGIGLFRLRPWAWALCLALAPVSSIVYLIYPLMVHGTVAQAGGVSGMLPFALAHPKYFASLIQYAVSNALWLGVLLWYLSRVRSYFIPQSQ